MDHNPTTNSNAEHEKATERTSQLLRECWRVLSQLIPLHIDSALIGEQKASGIESDGALMKSISKTINQGTHLCIEIEKLKLWRETK